MSHARIEEVSDSDSDPAEGDISDLDDFDEREILKARPSQVQPPVPNPSSHLIDPSAIPAQPQGPISGHDGTQFQTTQDDSKYKDFQCIYPVYFDKSRSRAEGRRVGTENAVENPLAREIVSACGRLRLETLFEPSKLHPKDWSNPGRVKVKLKGSNNPLVNNSESSTVPGDDTPPLETQLRKIGSEHHLYILIAKHLKENPTTEESAIRVRVPGAPTPDMSKPYPRPAVPRGWKMNTILPYYSPAMTGGGVSENFLKDVMSQMQGQMPGMAPPGLEGMDGGGDVGGKNREKKKKIKA